jgi:hypothetical protein
MLPSMLREQIFRLILKSHIQVAVKLYIRLTKVAKTVQVPVCMVTLTHWLWQMGANPLVSEVVFSDLLHAVSVDALSPP